MSVTVEVQSRVVGNTGGDLSTVLFEVFEERITLKELILRTVQEQISQMLAEKRMEAARVKELLDRQYLPADEIASQATRGAIRFPSARQRSDIPQIDANREGQRALDAFTAGKFAVLAGGHQYTRLDEEMDFAQQTSVIFLRLTPLVGG